MKGFQLFELWRFIFWDFQSIGLGAHKYATFVSRCLKVNWRASRLRWPFQASLVYIGAMALPTGPIPSDTPSIFAPQCLQAKL